MERHFTYVSGTSSKFWAVALDGSTVTVRFGRIGTNGQSQTKALPDDAAALAHRDKLVAEKLAKGYLEDAGAPAPAPKTTDEDTWVVPPAWWRQTDPFRGLGPARTVTLDPGAEATVAAVHAERADSFAGTLAQRESDPELVEAARRHLAGTPDPLGAAVVATAVLNGIDWERFGAVADEWTRLFGVAFAAQAAAYGPSLRVVCSDPFASRHFNALARAGSALPPFAMGAYATRGREPVLMRVRQILAASDEATYADAVEKLAGMRDLDADVRAATSVLAPTEQAWVAADAAETRALGAREGAPILLLASVTRVADAADVLEACPTWAIARHPSLFVSLAAHVGPPSASLLMRAFDEMNADFQKRLIKLVCAFPTDEAFGLLLTRIDRKHVQPALLEAMTRFPRRAARLLAEASGGHGARAAAARELLRGHGISHPDLVAPQSLPPGAPRDMAPAGRVPELLGSPPWERRRARPPVEVADLPGPSPLRLAWLPGEREAWASAETGWEWWGSRYGAKDWANVVAHAGPDGRYAARDIRVLAHAPLEVARQVLHADLPAGHLWGALPMLRRVLARFGDEALEFVVQTAQARPAELAGALEPVEGGAVAARMAEWADQAKTVRATAQKWLVRHPAAAAADLLGPALGPLGPERGRAVSALRFLDRSGHGDAARAAALAAGSAAASALGGVLAADPVDDLPARMPKLPAWLDVAHLPAVLVSDGRGALPHAAAANLCLMLTISRIGEPYAGLTAVRPELDAASLAGFAWGLFERWRLAGYPAKDGWVLDALGLLGDDDVVRGLAPLIRAWPGESAHKRAVAGLDVLTAIGTDLALMHLHGISEKVKFAGLKERAREKVAEVAAALELTPDQLADRVVPDLGLGPDGTLLLDFGPRRFRVGLDEQLRPTVADEDGTARKLLPKAAATDDPQLAAAATARFAALKKDARAVATDQIRRLERAMVGGRRWTPEEHRRLFVEHPLVWHLARRLVWITVDGDGSVVGSVRVAEDRTYADSTDTAVALPEGVRLGVAHPLHLDAPTWRAWSELFADYEILQPFPQLGRETYGLTADERESSELERLAGLEVPTGRILGLDKLGWSRGDREEAGIQSGSYKVFGDGWTVSLGYEPGIASAMLQDWATQTLGPAFLDREGLRHRPTYGDLDPILASEILRDLESLRG